MIGIATVIVFYEGMTDVLANGLAGRDSSEDKSA